MFDADYFALAFQSKGIPLEDGLSELEFDRVQRLYNFRFPPDLRSFLGRVLPVGPKFPNWRTGLLEPPEQYQDDGVVGGFLFDIEHNGIWFERWGEKPKNLSDALEFAQAVLNSALRLVPIYAHRFIPTSPCEVGNPVMSIMQTDIICYGTDLGDYFCNEFKIVPPLHAKFRNTIKFIEFWSMFLEDDSGINND